MTDDEVVRTVRERELLRALDRASQMRARLLAQLAVVDEVRSSLVAQMRLLVDPDRPVDGLEGLSRRELYRLAGEHAVVGRSRMDKQRLLEALRSEGVTVDGAAR